MKSFLSILFILQGICIKSQSAETLFRSTLREFNSIQSYSAELFLEFNIPSIHLERLKAKVYFQQPDRFKIKSQGIAFLPKQNPFSLFKALSDSVKYSLIENSQEMINGVNTRQLVLIPENHPEIVLAKLWIDPAFNRIQKSQITTKNDGTLEAEYSYAPTAATPLPESMLFKFESLPFKIPKAMAADLNTRKKAESPAKGRIPGSIKMYFSKYLVNTKLPPNIFSKD